jgi:FAD/FMN-containing dehydrogenase/Fe-S oxidoreductase
MELPLTLVPPPAPAKAIDVTTLAEELADGLDGEVRFDRLSRALYSTDASVYQIVPLGVVLPASEADVVHTVKVCAAHGLPLTARGGGTSQAGQAIGPGVILDFSKHFHEIVEINPTERWVRVRPGCVLDDLNLALQPHGLQFAPDVSTSNRATIGGMIANNSCGAHSIVYGKTVDHVAGLRVVLADVSVIEVKLLPPAEVEVKCRQPDLEGSCYRAVQRLAQTHASEIERRYPKVLRRVGGYNLDRFLGAAPFNLAGLLVGSEGTLGITVEARLALVPLPRARALLVVQFAELLDALAATPAILSPGPSAVEVVDRYVLDSTRHNAEAARLRGFLKGDPGAILLIEFFGDDPAELSSRLAALENDLRGRGHGDHFHRAADAAEQAQIWKLRRMALGLSMAQKGDAKAISFVEDSAVAPEHLRDYIADFLDVVRRHGTTAGVYAHASVGCLHVRPVIDLKTESGVRQFEAIAEQVSDLVLKYGGALSGEHGDGLVRSPFQEKMFGPELYEAFRELKRAFDPQGLLNPGKIVDAPPLATNLRYGTSYVTPSVPTTFDFSADGGIGQAAELCSGVGACRKKREGTMCPSYRATCDEQHTTRGRANALRLAITGQLGTDGLTDPVLKDVLDLCLECKACKSECPTNVDMARLKAEFLHQYFRKHGLPWRNRLLGRVDRWSRWGSRLAPVSNWVARNVAARWLGEKLLHMDRRRLPPPFARLSFYARSRELGDLDGEPKPDRILYFFSDTFTKYYEPEVGLSAFRCLQQSGWFVVPLLASWPGAIGCCGRPMISNGLLDQAVDHAKRNVQALYPGAAVGAKIVACEPSCILTIKDDYPALLRGDLRRKAETVAAACLTFEEAVLEGIRRCGTAAKEWASQAGQGRVLVQAHCHQRSLLGMNPLLSMLRLIPGARVIDLDAGCCGMAGSFGYEKEHYEISRLVGEQSLFPAIRAADKDDVIVAPGFSCRWQIRHFTGRTALHPAKLLVEHRLS